MIVGLVGTIAAAIIGAAGAYLIARRKNSGDISSSDADVLWRESSQLRAIYREEVEQLRAEGVAIRTEVTGLREDVITLRHEAAELRKEAAKWHEESERCHAELLRLQRTDKP